MTGNSKNDLIGPMQYDPKVNRKSLEDPLRSHRRSSIPFADRRPAVRFIRSVDQRKRSIAGPYDPASLNSSQKPILKKSSHPILVDSNELGAHTTSDQNLTTNDELENCRYRTEIIMDKISRAERIGRGSVDVLTFPCSTKRVEALSRYHGCMTICVSTVNFFTATEDFNRRRRTPDPSMKEVEQLIEIAHDMKDEAKALLATARKFHQVSKERFNEWEELLKRNADFRTDQGKLKYPLYSNKKMPESVTLYEDAGGEDINKNSAPLEGYIRAIRSYPENSIMLHAEFFDGNEKLGNIINFQETSREAQLQAIRYMMDHGRALLRTSRDCLQQGVDLLLEQDLDESFEMIQSKINSLEYDDMFDPLCALDLKNAMGELATRKAELLNTSEQMIVQCKWLIDFTDKFHKFTRRRIKGSNILRWLCCMEFGCSQRHLLQLLGIVTVEDIVVLLPLTVAIAEDLFVIDVSQINSEVGGGEETPKKTSK